MRIAITVLSAVVLSASLAQTPAPPQVKSVLVRNATVHVGDGRTIDEGAVGFRDGRIDYVGYAYGVKAAYDTVIDATGTHVYPGFILPDNTLGLQEIEYLRHANDFDETGDLTPETRTLTSFKVDSRVIPTVRSNGVLIEQAVPRNGTIAGRSAIMRLDGWDWEDATVVADDGLHMNWPRAFTRTGWWAEPGETTKDKGDERAKKLDAITRFFQQAKAYHEAGAHPDMDLRMEAMRGLFTGAMTLFVNANLAREIQEAVLFAKELGVKKLVIVGGYDAWRVADLLRDNKVDVILQRLHSLPLRDDDDVDLNYRLPRLMKDAGIRFCLGYAGNHEPMGARNLAFVAGTASAYGLSREEALTAITLDAARILGIEARYGSLEVGKSATLFVSTGDALDMRTNNVVNAWIDGRMLDLDDHQKQLYRQYKAR